MPKPFSAPDRQRQPLPLLAVGRRRAERLRRRGRPARPRPVEARVPLPRRAAGPRPGAVGAHRADRQLLQAAVDRRVPHRRPLGVHLDARVHHVRRQQPDPDVPDARSRAGSSAASVSGAVNPYLGHGGVHRARASTASSASSTRASRSIGAEHVRDAARGVPAARACGTCRSRCPRRSTSSRRDEVVQGALGPELAAEFLRVKRQRVGALPQRRRPLGDRPVPDAVLSGSMRA